jgi:hypothetical protein
MNKLGVPFRFLSPVVLFCFVVKASYGQETDSLKSLVKVDFEIRPRAEYRNNYRRTASETNQEEFFVDQRNRIGLTYEKKNFKIHASLQEIHVWGRSGTFSAIGSINAYELYAEGKLTEGINARIGRQSISLDNGRLFSAAPWAQQSRSHEGIRLFYKSELTTDLFLGATRPYADEFDSYYSPVASHQYKWLAVHHLYYKIHPSLTLTTINAADIFESDDSQTTPYHRITSGGRIEFLSGKHYVTLSGYYQFGRQDSFRSIYAYYLQPEIKTSWHKFSARLGAEISSGDKEVGSPNQFRSFVPLYGVAWKFMGNMNLFTRFPSDVNSRGLVNPYLFLQCTFDKNLSIRWDWNLFYSQYQLQDPKLGIVNRYLGFENDISVSFKGLKNLDIQAGFSYLLPEKSMELLQKVSKSGEIPVWSYLMVSYRPEKLAILIH